MLSLFGCIFNLISIFVMKKSREPLIRIAIVICILDLTYAAFSLTEFVKNPSAFFCEITEALQYFGYLGSIIATCCFAHALLVVFRGGNAERLALMNQRYALTLLSSTILLTITFILTQSIDGDFNKEYCWQTASNALADYWLYLPPAMAILFCGTCYVLVIRRLKEAGGGFHLELTLYPLILVICYFPWVFLDIISHIMGVDSYPEWLVAIADLLWNSQGFLNAITYGLSRRMFRECKQLCLKRRSLKKEVSMHEVRQSEVEGEPATDVSTSR